MTHSGAFIGREGGGLTQAPPREEASRVEGPPPPREQDWCFGLTDRLCPSWPGVRQGCEVSLQALCLLTGVTVIGLLIVGLAVALVLG